MSQYDGLNLPQLMDLMHGLVMPEAVPWLPQTPGWWVVLGWLVVVLMLVAWQVVIRRRRNRYRREALQSLAKIRATDSAERAQDLPELLKRAALTAWPRSEVAALTGEHWHRFLDRSAGMDRFGAGAGRATTAQC